MSAHGDLTTPVVLILFNRPDHVRRVFEAIALVRPKRLYLIADGPRSEHSTDPNKCERARAVVEHVSWPCRVETNFATENMGCRERTISGTDWVFSRENEAIILDDDTVPDPSFFYFCHAMLERYRNDRRIMCIRGVNHGPPQLTRYSYSFSRLSGGWGRALWRRSWQLFDPTMTAWPEVRDGQMLRGIFANAAHFAYWQRIMQSTYEGRFDSWSYPFALSCWLQSGLTVVPARNLVRNIGIGADSTHTKVDLGHGKIPVQSIEFPLCHPPFVIADRCADDHLQNNLVRQTSLHCRIKNRIRRFLVERQQVGP